MSNLPILGLREFTTAGAPLAGGKLYFYSAGTVNAKNTYSVEACTAGSENANPVVADANGRFGEIYLLGDEPYKVILKTSADVLVDEWDNVNATSLASSSVVARQKQIASNPLDYGALGDGASDESAYVQDAIDAATGTVDLLGKTFRCDSGIVLAEGITLRNGALDFSQCTDNEYITARGTRGSAVLLTGNATAGDESIDVASAAGLAAGDWLYLYATDAFGGGSDGVGEMVRIASVAGLTVNLAEPLFDSYTTANNAAIKKLSLVERVALQDLVVTCSASASGSGYAIVLDLCNAPSVRNVVVNSPKAAGVSLLACAGGNVSASTVYGSSTTGVGFDIGAHARNVNVTGCAAYQLATGYRIGRVDTNDGVTRMCSVRESAALGCTTGIGVEINSELCSIQGSATTLSGGAQYVDLGTGTAIIGVQDITAAGLSEYNYTGGSLYRHTASEMLSLYRAGLIQGIPVMAGRITATESRSTVGVFTASGVTIPGGTLRTGSTIRVTAGFHLTTTTSSAVTVGISANSVGNYLATGIDSSSDATNYQTMIATIRVASAGASATLVSYTTILVYDGSSDVGKTRNIELAIDTTADVTIYPSVVAVGSGTPTCVVELFTVEVYD